MADDPRAALKRLAAARGASLSALSRMLGRNVAYLGQYVHRGTPRLLPERERGLLADFFGVDDALFGAPARRAIRDAPVGVPYLAVAASAGPGMVAADERIIRAEPFAADMLRDLGMSPAMASIIAVTGDSMAPGLLDGDRILVDRGDTRVPRTGDVFVIRLDDLLAVKRVSPRAGGWRIVSDNPAHATVERAHADVAIVGRARLLLRGL